METLIHEREPFGARNHTDGEREDHNAGFRSGVAGQPNDDTQSSAWQRGWADAQEVDHGTDRETANGATQGRRERH